MQPVVLLIARQEQLQVGDQVIARVTGTEARLSENFEVEKLHLCQLHEDLIEGLHIIYYYITTYNL